MDRPRPSQLVLENHRSAFAPGNPEKENQSREAHWRRLSYPGDGRKMLAFGAKSQTTAAASTDPPVNTSWCHGARPPSLSCAELVPAHVDFGA